MEDISLGAGGEGGGVRVYYSLWARGEENSLSFSYIKSKCPGQPRGVARASNHWTDAVIPFSSHGKMTNEIQICFSK